jgi:choline/glycine/proline betaine transport protein
VFWASSEGVVAATLLLAGGLGALQTMTIVSALPFSVIMIISAAGMWRALMIEDHHSRSLKTGSHQRLAGSGGRSLWRDRLQALVNFPTHEEVMEFMDTRVRKAMLRVARELVQQDWQATVQTDEEHNRIYLEISKDDQVDFVYEIRLVEHSLPDFAYPEMPGEEPGQKHYCRAEVFLRRGGQSYDVYDFDQQDIITDILDQFEKHLHFLHISPAILPWRMEAHDEMLSTPGQLRGDV